MEKEKAKLERTLIAEVNTENESCWQENAGGAWN
jgi:hypothetical protein